MRDCPCSEYEPCSEHQSPGAVVLPLSEAAAELGVDPGTLRVQIHNGKLRAMKIGPIWTVSEKEVERYARENRRG